jgi:hypothetical protein
LSKGAAAARDALALTLLLSPLPRALAFSELSEHSFAGPFTTFDREGLRVVPSWSHGGSAVVNEHFVRLTPDRQSKSGWLWSSTPMLADAWSATLRFRVSGQGKSLFGDGVALWFTRDRAFVPGPLHGHAAAFEGFAVIFDTYVNAGGGVGAGAHRDVALLSSDGSPLAGADGAPTAPHDAAHDAACTRTPTVFPYPNHVGQLKSTIFPAVSPLALSWRSSL